MAKFAAIYSALGIAFVLWSMLRGTAHRHIGPVSLRNIFLLGFVYFQFYAAIYPLWTGDYGEYAVYDETRTASRWIAYTSLFLGAFYFASERVIRKVETQPAPPTFAGGQSPISLAMLAVVLATAAFFGRFSGYVPLIGPLLNHALLVLAASSAGIATFVLVRHYFNPALAVPTLLAIGLGLVNTILADFGRRGLVGIFAAVLWCGYFSRESRLTISSVFFKAAPIGLVVLLIVGSFGEVRKEKDLVGNVSARSEAILDNIGIGAFTSFFRVPDTAIASLWIIDSRNRDLDTKPLFAVEYFVLHFVPRPLMPDKPEPLSRRIPIEAGKKGVSLGLHTVGPGVIGHIGEDGGLLVAPLYGLILGGLFGMFDRFLIRNVHAPLAVAGMGCALGQVLGLARGDTSIFLGIILIGLISNVGLFLLLDRLLGNRTHSA